MGARMGIMGLMGLIDGGDGDGGHRPAAAPPIGAATASQHRTFRLVLLTVILIGRCGRIRLDASIRRFPLCPPLTWRPFVDAFLVIPGPGLYRDRGEAGEPTTQFTHRHPQGARIGGSTKPAGEGWTRRGGRRCRKRPAASGPAAEYRCATQPQPGAEKLRRQVSRTFSLDRRDHWWPCRLLGAPASAEAR
jgi:hypothetical protein